MQNNKIGSGLQNMGNTCFFNAVIQVILYSPSLALDFGKKSHSSSCKNTGWCVLCSLQKLWEQSKKKRVVTPSNLISNVRTFFKKFRLGRQEDSHEFLRYLVECMQEAETGKLGKDQKKNQISIAKSNTFFTFGGKMRTFVLCLNCKHRSLTTERYYDLSIECQRSNTLHEGLQNYFKVDDLNGANKYRCDSCKQLCNAKKGFKIMSLPTIVTFQMKRFTNTLRKIGKLVDYPRVLDMSKYMQKEGESTKLELYGVIVHAGSSASSGHYYAFVKNGGEWYEMNDSNVSRVSEERILKQQAYLLFYARTNPRTLECQIETESTKGVNDIMTNIIIQENNKNQKVKKEIEKSKSQSKQPRKQSFQELEMTRRKLSADVEQIKQGIKKQNQMHANNESNGKLNEKKVRKVSLSNSVTNQQNENNSNKVPKINGFNHINHTQKLKDSEQSQDFIPLKLQKKKSKGEMQAQLPLSIKISRDLFKIKKMSNKLINSSRFKGMRSLSTLRYLQKTRKLRKIPI